MSRLTHRQIEQIKKIINEHMSVVMHITVGGGNPSPTVMRKLRLPKSVSNLIKNSYQYGRLCMIKDVDIANMSQQDVVKMFRALKLTPEQQRSIDNLQTKTSMFIDNLTQKIITNTVTAAIQSDLEMWGAVKDVVPTAIENNINRAKVVQQLRDKTEDMYRDWHRVAQTEMWGAKCQGEADAIMNGDSSLTNKKGETIIYIKPAYNACDKCKQMYLESDGVTPKTFTMAQLISNGNNYGKKQADWVPCVPPLHPNCQCVLNVKPDDTKFDSQGNLVYSKS